MGEHQFIMFWGTVASLRKRTPSILLFRKYLSTWYCLIFIFLSKAILLFKLSMILTFLSLSSLRVKDLLIADFAKWVNTSSSCFGELWRPCGKERRPYFCSLLIFAGAVRSYTGSSSLFDIEPVRMVTYWNLYKPSFVRTICPGVPGNGQLNNISGGNTLLFLCLAALFL